MVIKTQFEKNPFYTPNHFYWQLWVAGMKWSQGELALFLLYTLLPSDFYTEGWITLVIKKKFIHLWTQTMGGSVRVLGQGNGSGLEEVNEGKGGPM